MRLYKGQVPVVAAEITRTLIDSEVLEVEPINIAEVEKDIESVLNEYIRLDREINTEAHEIQTDQSGGFGRIKTRLDTPKTAALIGLNLAGFGINLEIGRAHV